MSRDGLVLSAADWCGDVLILWFVDFCFARNPPTFGCRLRIVGLVGFLLTELQFCLLVSLCVQHPQQCSMHSYKILCAIAGHQNIVVKIITVIVISVFIYPWYWCTGIAKWLLVWFLCTLHFNIQTLLLKKRTNDGKKTVH